MFIVTGASSGIGYATACELLRRGFRVVLVARRVLHADTLNNYGSRAICLSADVATEEGRRSIASVVADTPIQGIVHSAGSSIPLQPYEALSADRVQHDMAVHVLAPIAINNLFRQQLSQARIVYIDSYSASALRVGWSGYSIVKAAAQMAAKSAAAEFSHAQIIRVFPGGVKTQLIESVLNSTSDSPTTTAFKKMDSEGTLVAPEVIGRYVAQLLVDADEKQLESREYWDFNNPNDHCFD